MRYFTVSKALTCLLALITLRHRLVQNILRGQRQSLPYRQLTRPWTLQRIPLPCPTGLHLQHQCMHFQTLRWLHHDPRQRRLNAPSNHPSSGRDIKLMRLRCLYLHVQSLPCIYISWNPFLWNQPLFPLVWMTWYAVFSHGMQCYCYACWLYSLFINNRILSKYTNEC